MSEYSGFFDSVNGDRKYLTSFIAEYFASFIGNGVFPTPSTVCQVISNGNMTVSVSAGKAWINGYYYNNSGVLPINIDVADGVLKRIDRIVLQYNNINRTITAKVKKGTFASTPVAPSLQRDADIYELGLADVLVTNGAISILQSAITDLRGNSNYCGIVAGTVSQIDGTNLFAQFTAIFNEWFNGQREILTTDVAGNMLNTINDIITEIGEMTGLTTTEKSNLVGAINELVTGIGVKTALTTTAKDNLVSAINEMNSNYTKQTGAGTTTGSANTYVLTLSPAPTALVDNFCVAVKINVANTGASTINVNGLGAKPIVNSYGTAVTAGDLVINSVYTLRYNGTSFVIQGAGVTATEKTAWNAKLNQATLDTHAAVIPSTAALGHIKTDNVDAAGNLILNYGRYQQNNDLEKLDLSGCIIKDKSVQLAKYFSGVDVEDGNTATVSSNTTQSYYWKYVLDSTALAGKLPRILTLYLVVSSYASWAPQARLVNKTTGQYGDWISPIFYTPSVTAQYFFGSNDITYTAGDAIEIQFGICMGNSYTYKKSTALPTFVTGYYVSSFYNWSSQTQQTSNYPTVSILYSNVTAALTGQAVRKTKPFNLRNWGNALWDASTPANTAISCNLLNEATAYKKTFAYASNEYGTKSLHYGLKFKSVINLAGVKIRLSNQSVQTNIDTICIMDASKNIIKTISMPDFPKQGRYIDIYFDFIANTTYYIGVTNNRVSNWTVVYSTQTFPQANTDISILGGLYQSIDITTKVYALEEITPIEYGAAITSLQSLSGYSASSYPELLVCWKLTRTDAGVSTPVLSSPGVSWISKITEKPTEYEMIASLKITDSASPLQTIIIDNIPTQYEKLYLVIEGLRGPQDGNLTVAFNDETGTTNYVSKGMGKDINWESDNASTLQLGHQVVQPLPFNYYYSSNSWNFLQFGMLVRFEAEINQKNPNAFKTLKTFNEYQGCQCVGGGAWRNVFDRIRRMTFYGPGVLTMGEIKIYGGN